MTATFLISFAIRLSIPALIALAFNAVRPRSSAAERHLVWMLSLVAMVVLPMAMMLLPALRVIPLADHAPVAAQLESESSSAATWLSLIWIAGTISCLIRLIAAHLRARSVVRAASPDARWSQHMGIEVRSAAKVDLTFSCGIINPIIVLSVAASRWPEHLVRATLIHESAHVHRRDSLALLLSQLAIAIYWWHPAVWLIARAAAWDRERACDDAVLRAGVRAADYGSHLIANATIRGRQGRHLAAAMLSDGDGLKERISSLLDTRLNRSRLTRTTAFVACASAVIVLVLTASTAEVMEAAQISAAPVVIMPQVQAPIASTPSPAPTPRAKRPRIKKEPKIVSPDLSKQAQTIMLPVPRLANIQLNAMRMVNLARSVAAGIDAARMPKTK